MATLAIGLRARFGRAGLAPAGFHQEVSPSHLRFLLLLVFLDLCIDDHGSFVICRSASVRPKHLCDQNFDHDYFFELPLTRERDAPSSGRRFTERHVRYRAVPRTNRTTAPSSRAYQPKTARVERSRTHRALCGGVQPKASNFLAQD